MQRKRQSLAVEACEPPHRYRIGRWHTLLDIRDLLRRHQIEERVLRFQEPIEILSPADAERLDALEPHRRRTLDHVMADRQRSRGADDAEQPGLLEIDAALLGAKAAE